MLVRRFTVGRFFTNCYIVVSEKTREAVIIDPGFDHRQEAEEIYEFVESRDLEITIVVNTHGHPDHTCGNGMVKKKFGVPILIHEYDAHMLQKSNRVAEFFGLRVSSPPADKILHEEDTIEFGDLTFEVLHTPGHSRGCISLKGKNEVFTGDTLFAGSIGRIDFPDSSRIEMKRSLEKLENLPVHFIVYPGHGPETTIREEKLSNPFLKSL
ncbi:MAG: MBL fold metallo-hydrolase [Candidatus Bathyarchaeota archaeon]|jgi:glyoxylase-like metal-dependent hydrolase (beta-lactamase superfamily II)